MKVRLYRGERSKQDIAAGRRFFFVYYDVNPETIGVRDMQGNPLMYIRTEEVEEKKIEMKSKYL